MQTIWIFSNGDALPGESWGHKHGMYLSENLVENGYNVVYWVSSFSHALKVQRTNKWDNISHSDKLSIRVVPCRSYQKHIGIDRFLSSLDYALGIYSCADKEHPPNCIILGIPHLFLDFLSVILIKRYKSSLILDFRDLWPELFKMALPRWLKWASKLIFSPFYLTRRIAFSNADGLTSVCKTYRDIAFKQVPNLRIKPNDIIYSTGVEVANVRFFMDDLNFSFPLDQKKNGDYWVIYAGTLGENYDIKNLLIAAKIIAKINPRVVFLIAGDGPLRNLVIEAASDKSKNNIKYLGVLERSLLYKYYSKADLGLSLYSRESTVVIPAKAFDYFAAKIPIINSLPGEFAQMLKDDEIGFNYEAENPDSLVETILMALSDDVKLEKMKQNMENVSRIYDRDEQYNKYSKILDQVLKKNIK